MPDQSLLEKSGRGTARDAAAQHLLLRLQSRSRPVREESEAASGAVDGDRSRAPRGVCLAHGRAARVRLGSARQCVGLRYAWRQAQALVGRCLLLRSSRHRHEGAEQQQTEFQTAFHSKPHFLCRTNRHVEIRFACHAHHHIPNARPIIWSSSCARGRASQLSLWVCLP